MTPDERRLVLALAGDHGITASSVVELPPTGTINRIFLLDDALVLRLPHDTPKAHACTRCELVAAPLAIGAGLTTPRLVAADASLRRVGVPYTIYEQAPGVTASAAGIDLAAEASFWQDVGEQAALLHRQVTSVDDRDGRLMRPVRDDPREMPAALARDFYLGAEQARWLDAWIARLASGVVAPEPERFLHADLHPANLSIDLTTRRLGAVLDWNDAGFGAPSLELRCVPLRAVDAFCAGYARGGGRFDPDTLGARVLWDHLCLVLERIRNERAGEGPRWASEPVTPLWELARFMLSPPPIFRAWLPQP